MSVVIFGSGKWARLIGNKLNTLSINCLYVGSSGPNIIPRDKIQFAADYFNKIVIIASATKEHYSDFLLALKISPRMIFIEKGFYSPKELILARNVKDQIKTFFLSQYRFSKVFDVIKELNIGPIKKTSYSWGVNSQNVAEWVPHIVSIDNYIKNVRNNITIDGFGRFQIDSNTDVDIYFSEIRKLMVKLETGTHHVQINFGVDNLVDVINFETAERVRFEFKGEDCLHVQMKKIFIENDVSILECL